MKHKNFDVVVVGGGHAGVEASLISRKLNQSTAIITMDPSAIGRMSCNPAIGGLAKGQMVREIDVLGGLMGFIADQSGLQFKTLNKKKGRAVWSPRAQVDKRVYESLVLNRIKQSGVRILSGEVVALKYSGSTVTGVLLRSGKSVGAKSVIITAGTFLSGIIHVGNRKINAGRMGEERAEGLTEHLTSNGFISGRLKTGTPPRLKKETIDFRQGDVVYGDQHPVPFSYSTSSFNPPNEACYVFNTNENVHNIIQENLNKSPMFSGEINGVGPRYCPSVEDKIHRFRDKKSHVLFLEPEWLGSDQIYLNGFSTSLPEKVQLKAIREVRGLSKVEFFRPGYAIEYDFFPPSQLKSSLESKDIDNLYFAGQINGTSGYEEAAAQGLVSGINASLKNLDTEPLVLNRNNSYTGVMIDDLITKDTTEPYRMFTSRAEHRLLLRFSNTCDRLSGLAKKSNTATAKENSLYNNILNTKRGILEGLNKRIYPSEVKEHAKLKHAMPAKAVLKRNEITIFSLPRRFWKTKSSLPLWVINDILFDVESEVKYEGYIQRSLKELAQIDKSENLVLSKDFNYSLIRGLSSEAIEKLSAIRPESLGQAKRISGITPSDIAVLSINLSKTGRFT